MLILECQANLHPGKKQKHVQHLVRYTNNVCTDLLSFPGKQFLVTLSFCFKEIWKIPLRTLVIKG